MAKKSDLKNKESKKLIVKQDNWIVQETFSSFDFGQNQFIKMMIAECADLKEKVLVDRTIYVTDLLRDMGLSDSGKNYQKIRNAISVLKTHSTVEYYMVNPELRKREVKTIFYFDGIDTNLINEDDPFNFDCEMKIDEKEKYYITVHWGRQIQQFLTGRSRQFSQMELHYYLKLRSPYAQNLYELLKSYQNYEKKYNKLPRFEIGYLRKKLNVQDKNKSFSEFKKKCLAKPIERINELTDIRVELIVDKSGNEAIACLFRIEQKTPAVNCEGCWFENEDELNEIIYDHGSKSLIYKLSEIKSRDPDEYDRLRKGGKSDYDIIMKWIKNKQIIENVRYEETVIPEDEDAKIKAHIENGELPRWYGIVDDSEVEPELLAKALELQKRGS